MQKAGFTTEQLYGVRFILTDVDDTLTTGGKLLPETFQALQDLHDADIKVVPVTGGCAGWCDQFARLWPVSAVIGENGAFYITMTPQGHLIYRHWQPAEKQRLNQKRILDVADRILSEIPSLKLAKDQSYRLADVALDYNQDNRDASSDDVSRAIEIFRDAGINAKASSIHINAWIGDFNKSASALTMLENEFGLSEQQMKEQVLYIGDAPNDEPMFKFFPLSVGVANISHHWDQLAHHPAHVTEGESGHGFAEMAEIILRKTDTGRE